MSDISELISKGMKDGVLTYQEINEYLDEDNIEPEEFAALIKSESKRWAPVVRASGFAN